MATAAMSSSLANSPVAGTMNSRPTWIHAATGGSGILHLPKIRRGMKLRSCCAPAPPSDPDPWWRMPLSPEDLIEPTRQGLEELGAIWNALVEEPLRPIRMAVQEIKATKGDLFRCRCFHAGIVSGPLLLVAGFYQVYRMAPKLCVDIVLGYICYKLSVLAAELKRNGKANNLCARMQFVLLIVLSFKGDHSKDFYLYFTQIIWNFVLHLYACVVVYECLGVKHPKRYLEAIFKTLLKKGGVVKVLKFILFLGMD